MKKILFLTLISILAIGSLDAQQQSRSRSKKKNRKEDILERLWYGGGFNLGFSRSSIGSLGGNTFFVGVSPMVGYRLINNLSIGPRIELQYFTGRFEETFGTSQIFKYNSFTYGGGVFMRYKFLPILFAHIEYDYLSQESAVDVDYARGEIISERFGESLFLMGLGYTSGGVLASEIYILYDVLADSNTTALPIQYRFGFTYNF